MNESLISALVKVLFGSLAGGLTNTIAIWMLFHPYEPPKFLGRTLNFLHGAVPKNQPRLAKAIGRTVGERLLTEDDLTGVLAAEEFRAAFQDRLMVFLETLLNQERGSILELLPEEVRPEVMRLGEQIADGAAKRMRELTHEDEFEERIRERTERLVDQIRDEPVAGILTPAREEAFAKTVEEWLADAVDSPGFREAVEEYLLKAAERFLAPDRTLEEVLPTGLVSSVEKAVAGYLPLAIERLGSLLEDPKTRARFQRTVHDLLQRFLQDLKFHQRVVAKLVMNEDTLDRVFDTIESEGAERLSEMLREPEVQASMSRGVGDAFVDLLRRPVSSVFGTLEDDNVQEALETLNGWLVTMAGDPHNREIVVEKIQVAMSKAGARTWGDVLKSVPPERLAEWIASGARTETADRLVRDGFRSFATTVLERPIGTPSRWLPADGVERVERAITEPLWVWLQGQVPEVVARIDIARRVEEKVLQFPTPKMEELVRRVTDRELRTIVKLGYALGGAIGLMLVGVDAVLPRILAMFG